MQICGQRQCRSKKAKKEELELDEKYEVQVFLVDQHQEKEHKLQNKALRSKETKRKVEIDQR